MLCGRLPFHGAADKVPRHKIRQSSATNHMALLQQSHSNQIAITRPSRGHRDAITQSRGRRATTRATLAFRCPCTQELRRKIIRGQYALPPHLSAEATNLIGRMLELDPEIRISLTEICAHPWMRAE